MSFIPGAFAWITLFFVLFTPQIRADDSGGVAGSAAAKKTTSQQDKVDAVEARKTAIESEVSTLNKNRACAGDGECDVVEVGFRLCGGPSSYMVVSVSNPQLSKLKAKAAELAAVEKEMNLVNPPAECTVAPSAPEAACVKQVCQAADKKTAPAGL